MNQTIFLLLIIWIGTFYLLYKKQYCFILFPFFIFITNEILYYNASYTIFPTKNITENFYDISTIPTLLSNIDHNYSEGYYPNDDYSITAIQAENYKFDEILKYLGAIEGDTILDMGCGTSTFAVYCKTKNINVIGLTISNEQAKMAINKGVVVYLRDYTKFHKQFENIADHIIIMGSSEHISGGSSQLLKSYENKFNKIVDLMGICKKYFKNSGKNHRLFVSTLHIDVKFINTWKSFVLERTYGGTLLLSNLNISDILNKSEFKILNKRDSTKEYFMATKLNPNHFGNSVDPLNKYMILILFLGAFYPYLLYMYIYYVYGIWMWMFDGELHFYSNQNYTLKKENERPCTLWWITGEYYK